MGRKRIWPPKIQTHVSGQAFFRIKKTNVYLGPADAPDVRARYLRAVAEIEANGGTIPPRAKPTSLTVADVVARFMLHAETYYSARGRELPQFRYALAPLVTLYGDLAAADFRTAELEALQLVMASGSWQICIAQRHTKPAPDRKCIAQRHTNGWCRNVVNRHVNRVRTAWRWAERKGLVPEGRTAHLRTVPALKRNDPRVRHTKRRQGITLEQLQAVLPRIQERRKRRPCAAMLELGFWSGCRPSEVRLMRGCEIDREGGPVVDGLRIWLYTPDQHKKDHLEQPRVVALGPECQRVLAPWLDSADPEAYLFPSGRAGTPYTDFSYAQAVRRGARKAGVRLVPYNCRHAARKRVTHGMSLDHARAYLGHATAAQAAEYAHGQDVQAAAEAARRLG